MFHSKLLLELFCLSIIAVMGLCYLYFWSEFLFVSKLAGYKIRNRPRTLPWKYRIDIGTRSVSEYHLDSPLRTGEIVQWHTVREARRGIKGCHAWSPRIVRVLYFKDKVSPFNRNAYFIEHYLTGEGSRKSCWSFFSRSMDKGRWDFVLRNKDDYSGPSTTIFAPQSSDMYYPCDIELCTVLFIATNYHCIHDLALKGIQSTVPSALLDTRNHCQSEPLKIIRKFVERGAWVVKDDPFPSIDIEKEGATEEKEPVPVGQT